MRGRYCHLELSAAPQPFRQPVFVALVGTTGLPSYHARYYDPVLARFVSADTLVPGAGALTVWPSDGTASPLFAQGAKDKDGKPTSPQNPQTLNRYGYVTNNPIRLTDPMGHCGYGLSWDMVNGQCYQEALRQYLDPNRSFIDHVIGFVYAQTDIALVSVATVATAGAVEVVGAAAASEIGMTQAIQQVNKVAETDGMLTIGRLPQTTAAAAKGANIIPSRFWSLQVNDVWIRQAIRMGVTFRAVSALERENYFSPSGGETVFGREIRLLLANGYEIVDDLLVPPSAHLK